MATSVISGTIQDSSGTALANVQVTAVLRPRPAFVTATGVELSSILSTVTDASGVWSLTLTEQADITPANSYYEITERISERYGGAVTHRISVGANNTTVFASLVTSPPEPDPSDYLTQSAADARYVQSPGSFAVVGNVSESRPADAASAGVLDTYARGDHKHDREQIYLTAAARAALTGTDLYNGLQVVESDTGQVMRYHSSAWVVETDLDGWLPYNTVWTGALANGVAVARYMRIGRLIRWRIKITWGNATSHPASGQIFTLPVAPHADYTINALVGSGSLHDSGTAVYLCTCITTSGSSFVVTTGAGAAVTTTNTSPFTWVTNDQIFLEGTYEAAA